MPQNWQTVAIPFAAGIKPTSRGRMLDQVNLQTAQNCFYVTDQGPQKRNGHTSRTVETGAPPPGLDGLILPSEPPLRTPFSLSNPGLGDFWLHGYGLLSATDEDSILPGTFAKSPQPRIAQQFGGWQRDNEIVSWDGFRALSSSMTNSPYAEVAGEAVMPGLRGYPIAKSLNGQLTPDAVDNGVVRSVAWIHNGDVYRSVFSSSSLAPLVVEQSFGLTGATCVRLVTIGAWTHAVIHDQDIDEVLMRSWHQDTPSTVVSRSLGEASSPVFDIKKRTESQGMVARILAGNVLVTRFNASGQTDFVYSITPIAGSVSGTTAAIGVAIAPGPAYLGVIIQNADFDVIHTSIDIDSTLVQQAQAFVGPPCVAQSRFTIADNYSNHELLPAWTVYIEDGDLVTTYRQVRVYSVSDAVVLQTTRFNTQLASHAFRAGQRTYVWATGTPTVFELQPTWFLCDEKMLPIGKMLFGLGYVAGASVYTMPSVTWQTDDTAHAAKDRFVFFGALSYRQRANTEADTANPNGVWLEPSVFFYTLDFLPSLRSAQAGRSTYISGAQLWEYDGASLNEAGFHLAPEKYTVADGGAGNLDETKQYNWRIDLCYKNAQNEEVRSWSSTVSVAANSFGSGTFKATITVPHVPMTRRDNSYFLVFRTEGDGTEYYLVSSRDPAQASATENGFLFNSRGAKTYTFTDNLADTALIDNEYHPTNATGYIQPLPAPACEVVAAGSDRLWLAGGELSPGEIAPSRYFQVGEAPSFSPALNIQIDRNAEPITAIGFVGEQAVFFRKTSTYTMASDGPDNLAQGVWAPARLALSDVGAIAQETLALAGEGLYFQSPAGIRVITQGGGLRPPGAGLIGGLGTDIDNLAAEGDYAAAIVVPKYSQIRWYSRDPNKPSIVVDYTKNIWTTYTGLNCRAAFYWFPGSTVVLLRGAGEVWTEEEGRYLDNDRTYEMIVKTAWLHAANLGDFQRFRRFALYGEATDGLNLRFRVYYDERTDHTQEDQITYVGSNPDTLFNPSTWGGIEWGSGTWGDESSEVVTGNGARLWFRDNRFRYRARADRQKCSVFAIEFSDQGSQALFVPVVLSLELGLKQGLDRVA